MAQPRGEGVPSWQDLYQAALAEPDENKLIELLNAIEEVMLLRVQELGCGEPYEEERVAMRRVGEKLLRIKIERLSWPAINLW